MTSVPKIRVRFPPSPTGELHLGSARTALYNYLFARKHGGKFIFRIEDTDQTRYVPGAMDRFIKDLKWLGLSWDEGPDVGGPYGPYIQSERIALYQQAAEQLVREGHAYRCYCTPERLEAMRTAQLAKKQPPKYDRHCLREGIHLEGQPSVIRFKIPEGVTHFHDLVRGEIEVANSSLDDFILLKSDGFPTYHLANVVDDHAMAITHVIRGEEWLPSTPKHILLYHAFHYSVPEFAHLPLLLATDKKKLSKRLHGKAVWVASYRQAGYLPEALVNYLALLGWNPGDEREFFTLDELTQIFSLERVHKAGAIFDPEKLRHFNAYYLRQLTDDELINQLRKGDFLPKSLALVSDEKLRRWVAIHRDRMTTLAEFGHLVEPIISSVDYPKEKLIFRNSDAERTKQGLQKALAALEKTSDQTWQTVAAIQQVLSKVVHETGLTNGDVFWPVRVALSGQEASAAPAELLWAFGKKESLKRLEAALSKLNHD